MDAATVAEIEKLSRTLFDTLQIKTQEDPNVCFFALATVIGAVVGTSTIDEEKACRHVQTIIRHTAKITRECLSSLQKTGSEVHTGKSDSSGYKVH